MARFSPSSVGERFVRWSEGVGRLVPDRHLYVRSPKGVRGVLLTTTHQVVLILAGGATLVWTLAASVALVAGGLRDHDQGRTALAQRLALERTTATREARLIAAAEDLARERSRRLRLILGSAGVDPPATPVLAKADGARFEGGDPGRLAADLEVDRTLAGRIQNAARAAAEAHDLAAAAEAAPLARPTPVAAWSSDFGVRRDPFTGRAAYHAGVDIPAPRLTPVYATARGVVSFAGPRSGYGATVEIDHGGGVMTRFAHMAAIDVRPGEAVDVHTRLGSVGSTGRSTGPHLHYEIWRNGRPQDPGRYLRAGDYVHEAG
jgi:murein DD-endopeptidase MepM/ murein hydrolase activator NlpD